MDSPMIERHDFEINSNIDDNENNNQIDDIFLENVDSIIEELEKSENRANLKRKKQEDEEIEFERLCIHKKYGCYQCRSDYKGVVDIEYHEKLNKLFNRMKRTITIINKTVN